ncbi:MAG TPA: ABC transporter substrate-binding protein [Candidatus Methanomethylicus sp.]|nr:ABC transporter substrate-binding protein [Candidatus Methanomethylicus sp.]HRU80951.1 ABC transporter substrate-binding protein [Candidatus Methanomethylicus sp.]
MKKILVVAIVAVIAIAAVAGFMLYKPPNAALRIGYLPAASYGLIWIAYESGMFESEGLEVTLVEYQNVGQLVTALASGAIDGAPLTSVAAAAFIRNVDMTIVAGNSFDGTALVTKNDINVTSLSDLDGMHIGTVAQVPGDFVFKRAISECPINVTYTTYLTPADALTALENGTVDASMLWEPYASLSEFRNLKIAVWDGEIYASDYPCCLQTFTSSFAKSNSGTIVKFIKALIKAEAYTASNPSESLSYVRKYIPEVSIQIIYNSIFYQDPVLGRPRNPLSAYFNTTDLQAFYQLLVPSLLTQNDFATLLSKLDPTNYYSAINSLKSEGFTLPQRYLS